MTPNPGPAFHKFLTTEGSGSERKTQNPSAVDSGTPDLGWPESLFPENFWNLRIRLQFSLRQGWARTVLHGTGSGLKPIFAGSGLDRTVSFWNLADQDSIALRKFCCCNVVILNISKISVVIRFYRFAKWECVFCHPRQKLCWDCFAIWTASTVVHTKLSSFL